MFAVITTVNKTTHPLFELSPVLVRQISLEQIKRKVLQIPQYLAQIWSLCLVVLRFRVVVSFGHLSAVG